MGGVSLLSQTNLETHDQIWSFLNQDAIAEASEASEISDSADFESICDDLSLNSEELYEEPTSESDSDAYGNIDNILSITQDTFLELENDFTDLIRYEQRNDYILEVQPSNERKRSISHIELPSKKQKASESSIKSHEEDFIVDSDEETTCIGGQTTEEKLTKMISQLDPLHLQKAIEIMSDNQSPSGEMRFDLSKMNQSKLLKLYDFVSKCHSNEIINLEDECWLDSKSPSRHSTPVPSQVSSTPSSPVHSPLTLPNTPSPISTPNRVLSPPPCVKAPSVFSQNKALEQRLKGLVKTDSNIAIQKPISKRPKSKKEEDEEIDILG